MRGLGVASFIVVTAALGAPSKAANVRSDWKQRTAASSMARYVSYPTECRTGWWHSMQGGHVSPRWRTRCV